MFCHNNTVFILVSYGKDNSEGNQLLTLVMRRSFQIDIAKIETYLKPIQLL
jgi:hypothetical protein